MDRPLRRFCFQLAEKLGKSVKEIFAMPSAELSEWTAYYLTQNEGWLAGYHRDKELARQSNLTPQELAAEVKKSFGVPVKGKQNGTNLTPSSRNRSEHIKPY